MTDDSPGRNLAYAFALVPVLAFGGTIAGMAMYSAGVLPEIQYAAAGGFLASCLLAYLAWIRSHKDIVALSTPIYGFIFLVTPIDYTGGVALQLVYAAGLTVLAARLRYRFGPEIARGTGSGLEQGPLADYVEPAFSGDLPSASAGHAAANILFAFAQGEYQRAGDLAHGAACAADSPGVLARACGILREHADLLEHDRPRPVTYATFLAADAPFLARTAGGDPDKDFDAQLDNALLLLYRIAWHSSPSDRDGLLSLRQFASRLLTG